MKELGQYIFTLTVTGILCAVTESMMKGTNSAPLVKLAAGLLLTITALSPLLKQVPISLDAYLAGIADEGTWAVESGEKMAVDTLSERMKEQTQAYISDKAALLGADLQVDVILSDAMPPIPKEVILTGAVSPYVKKQLANCITGDLGISEDNQVWIS